MTTFTKEQIHAWKCYEEVRLSGHYNMFDSRARISTGLDTKTYTFVMKNYSELKEAAQ
jgi:hypothetical protein